MMSKSVFVLLATTIAMAAAAAVPQYAAAVPQYAAAVPQYAAAVPQYAAAVPQYAAAVPRYDVSNQDLVIDMDEQSTREDVLFPRERRAALVLDRLLVALQKALHEEAPTEVDDGPRAAPLRYLDNDDMTGLQRRGQGMPRGRVLRCYFNAVTCF